MSEGLTGGIKLARDRTREGYSWVLRNIFNRGYLEYIQSESDKAKSEKEREERVQYLEEIYRADRILTEMAIIVTRSSRIPSDAPDEWFLFRDEMFEVERGYRVLTDDKSDSESMSES